MPKTIFREKRLTRRGCNFVIVNWFFYSAEQQLASRQKRAKKNESNLSSNREKQFKNLARKPGMGMSK